MGLVAGDIVVVSVMTGGIVTRVVDIVIREMVRGIVAGFYVIVRDIVIGVMIAARRVVVCARAMVRGVVIGAMVLTQAIVVGMISGMPFVSAVVVCGILVAQGPQHVDKGDPGAEDSHGYVGDEEGIHLSGLRGQGP